jgi:hypothetical protein
MLNDVPVWPVADTVEPNDMLWVLAISPVVIVRRPPSITIELFTFPSELELAKTTSPLLIVMEPVKVFAVLVILIDCAPVTGTPAAVAEKMSPLVPVLEITPEKVWETVAESKVIFLATDPVIENVPLQVNGLVPVPWNPTSPPSTMGFARVKFVLLL